MRLRPVTEGGPSRDSIEMGFVRCQNRFELGLDGLSPTGWPFVLFVSFVVKLVAVSRGASSPTFLTSAKARRRSLVKRGYLSLKERISTFAFI